MVEDGEASPRARILIAVGAGAALAISIVVIAVASGGDGSDGREVVAAPQQCVDAWNRDQAALAYGRHNFSFHLYEGALVTYLTPDGEEVGAGEGGMCAVIFPSEALDPEPFAAGQALTKDLWFPLSDLDDMELSRLAELQVLAAGSPNTTLDVEGKLTPL